ncbi:hypothetical protein IWW38_004280, partial [Coemansia aciculifera]
FRIEFSDAGHHPPFDAWVEVIPTGAKSEVIEVRGIPGSLSDPIVLPDHLASRIGRYRLRLLRTRDALGCEYRQLSDTSDLVGGGIDVEYIEAPTVRPASFSPASLPGNSVCLGDILAFDLRGLGPWSIDYEYNRARRSTTATKRIFRRIADVPGNFTITRVCHHQGASNDCCSEFDDGALRYAVRDIPRVRVGRQGVDVHQDILEGDLVNIPLYFEGQPPFTFTWQRRALALEGASGGKPKILESHTVKDLDAFEYTIAASSEGTFEVSFIQDKYCQYPKA